MEQAQSGKVRKLFIMLTWYFQVRVRGELNVRSAGAGSRLAHKPETRDEKTVGNKHASLIQVS